MTQVLVPAINRDAVWPALKYKPHRGQRLIHRAAARHRVAACGRRFGKSTIGGHELVPEAMLTYTMLDELEDTSKRREFWIVGPEYSDSEKEFRVVYNDLLKLRFAFDHPGTYNNAESGDMHISLFGGRYQVHAMSAKYPGTLVGEGLTGVIMAEAAKMKQSVWTKYIRPTLADQRGWSLFNSTPEGKNWFYELYMRGLDPASPAWQSWRMPSWMNDVVFPGGRHDPEILDMEKDMSEERFNQEIGASFTEFVGRVFKDFDEEVHVKSLAYDQRYPVYLAMDFGWTNPFVCLVIQVDVWDNIYVLGEYRVTHKDINDIADDLKGIPVIMRAKTMFTDPEAPGDAAVLTKKLQIPVGGFCGGELKWRLELIRQSLKVLPEHGPEDQKQPKLLVDRSCRELIREMLDYRYPETKEESLAEPKENPLKKDDHGPEALGRFMRGYYGGPGQDSTAKGRARVRKANIG